MADVLQSFREAAFVVEIRGVIEVGPLDVRRSAPGNRQKFWYGGFAPASLEPFITLSQSLYHYPGHGLPGGLTDRLS
jgi:hypothetical protein